MNLPQREANGWTAGQYGMFRVAFGAYLAVHFGMLLPYGAELFSREGVVPYSALSPLVRLFPNYLALADSPSVVTATLIVATIGAVLLAIGWCDRIAAVVLWYILACLLGRNPLISNPSLPFIGWLLLAHACVPPDPGRSWTARHERRPASPWKMPGSIFGAAWIVMAVSFPTAD